MKDLAKAGPVAHVAEIVHHGEKLILPDGMEMRDAIDLLQRRHEYLQETVALSRTFDVFPWDGANAMAECMARRYGWAAGIPTPGFFGSKPPQMVTIDVGPRETRQIPWGRFSLPNVKGYLETGVAQKGSRYVFKVSASVLRQDEATVNKLFQDIEDFLVTGSIYQGKAIKLRFLDDNGKALEMPEPKFLETAHITRDMLIYSRDIEESVHNNLFTPIERVLDCIENDISVKRGVLLGGPYGTGKTLAATVASKIAVDNGVTYIYIPRSDELALAIDFAQQYDEKAAVIFCEDIDRAVAGERTVEMDDILNILDGIDTKNSRIITVLTTNHLENINPAMLRPGRLDAVINVTPPDAEAAERLIRFYGGVAISADEDLTEAAALLNGIIPAVIAETVKRAKLVQLGLQEPGTKVHQLSGRAIYESAVTMQSQVQLLKEQSQPKKAEPTFNEVIGEAVARVLVKDAQITGIKSDVADIATNLKKVTG